MWKVFFYRVGLSDLTPSRTGCSRLCVLRSWRSYCPIPRKAQNWRWIGFIDHGSRIGGTTRSRNWGRDTKSFFFYRGASKLPEKSRIMFQGPSVLSNSNFLLSQTRNGYTSKSHLKNCLNRYLISERPTEDEFRVVILSQMIIQIRWCTRNA